MDSFDSTARTMFRSVVSTLSGLQTDKIKLEVVMPELVPGIQGQRRRRRLLGDDAGSVKVKVMAECGTEKSCGDAVTKLTLALPNLGTAARTSYGMDKVSAVNVLEQPRVVAAVTEHH